MSKHLGGIIGCKDKTSSWYFNGFPDGSNIGSTVSCRGEAHSYTVRVCCLPVYSGRQACGRISRVTQEQDHTGFLHLPSAVLALTFLARRIQPFLSLVDREVNFLCTNQLIALHLLGIFFFFSYFCEGKSHFV